MNRLDGPSYSYHSNASSVGDEDDSKDGINSKRQRVHFSCTECHRRKQKCNRQTPCQHCIARKIPDRCKTFQPGEDPVDLSTRVSALERSMQDNFQRVFQLLQDRGSTTLAQQTGSNQTQQTNTDAAGSEAGDEVLEGNQSPIAHQFAPSQTMTMKIDTLLDTFSNNHAAETYTDSTKSIESTTDLDALLFEYGATEGISQSLLAIFPSRELGDALMDHFFRDINWLRQPMSQRKTRALYEKFWESGPKLTADNINIYAILVILMATAICSIERPDLITEDARAVRLTARRLFYSARRALLASTMLGREDLQQVMAYSLASRFLLLDRRVTEAWTCVANGVKTAHSIGLHRDGTKLHLSEQETEVRRRVWSFVYFTDRMLCMTLGRPTQIDDNVVDTQLPAENDDLDVFSELMVHSPNTKSIDSPSPLTYTKHRHQLAFIMGKIILTYQKLHSPAHYGDIISIDKQLEQHRTSVPLFFRSDIDAKGELKHLDTSWDEVLPFVPIHRYLLESEIDHIRVSLHRPYLLRPNNKAGHRYEYSRRMCIAAAHRNVLLRKDIIAYLQGKFGVGKIPKAYHLHLGTYKTLNSLIIIGMYLVVTPEAEDANMLLGHLKYYSDLFKKKRNLKGYIRDDMKDREETIVNLFLQRIEQVRAEVVENRGKGGRGRQSKRGNDGKEYKDTKRVKKTSEEDTAGVLLDLNQSGRNKSSWPPSSNNAEVIDGKDSKVDMMAPWPYLPLNTHHNTTSSNPSSLSNSNDPSPTYDNSQDEGFNGGNSNVQSTNAQQLFESWFRYDAFDTMDFDTLNSNEYGQQQSSNQSQRSMTNQQQTSNFGMLSPLSTTYNRNDNSQQGLKGSTSYNPTASNVQFSTLPAPLWNSTSSAKSSSVSSSTHQPNQQQNQQQQQQQQRQISAGTFPTGAMSATGSSSTMSMNSTASTNPNTANNPSSSSSTNMPFALQPNTSCSGDPFNDASFDPNFWQSLIDKISS